MKRRNKLHKFFAAALTVMALLSLVHAGDITVTDFAGTGEMGYKDDSALKSTFTLPYSLAMDVDGGIIVVDCYSNRIRKIKDDKVLTIAGYSDKSDYYGFPRGGFKDGAVLEAKFNNPRDAAVDSHGNIYISDTGNHVIRKISEGVVYTFAGSGTQGFKNGSAGEVQFNTPTGLAVDKDDNIYVADTLNNVIRKITPDGKTTTFAGLKTEQGRLRNGNAKYAYFNEPCDIAIDADGSMFVLDSGNQVIRKIADGIVSTYCGSIQDKYEDTGYLTGGFEDGTAEDTRFMFPKGMYLADNGVLFIADTYNNRIRAVKPDGYSITLAGTGNVGRDNSVLLESSFNGPVSVLYNDGYLYIADMFNNLIRRLPVNPYEIYVENDPLAGISFKKHTDSVQIWLDKELLSFDASKPYISLAGKAMLPLEKMCEYIGAEITDIQAETIKITKDDKSFSIKLDSENSSRADNIVFIHSRVFASIFGFEIYWVPEYKSVVISTADMVSE
ncbi:MAG: SMP-30/gluconolactonase/LRE family protein [Bacillota bacterium]